MLGMHNSSAAIVSLRFIVPYFLLFYIKCLTKYQMLPSTSIKHGANMFFCQQPTLSKKHNKKYVQEEKFIEIYEQIAQVNMLYRI